MNNWKWLYISTYLLINKHLNLFISLLAGMYIQVKSYKQDQYTISILTIVEQRE